MDTEERIKRVKLAISLIFLFILIIGLLVNFLYLPRRNIGIMHSTVTDFDEKGNILYNQQFLLINSGALEKNAEIALTSIPAAKYSTPENITYSECKPAHESGIQLVLKCAEFPHTGIVLINAQTEFEDISYVLYYESDTQIIKKSYTNCNPADCTEKNLTMQIKYNKIITENIIPFIGYVRQ